MPSLQITKKYIFVIKNTLFWEKQWIVIQIKLDLNWEKQFVLMSIRIFHIFHAQPYVSSQAKDWDQR